MVILNEFTNIVKPSLRLVHLNAIYWNKSLVFFCILNIFWWNIVMDDWFLDENHLLSDSVCNIINL